MNICYKRASLEDIDNLLELFKEEYEIHMVSNPDIFKNITEDDYRSLLKELLEDKNNYVFKIIYDKKLVGYLTYDISEYKNHKTIRDSKVLNLRELIIDKNFRHRGIGTDALKHLIEYAKENKFNRIELGVWSFNKDAKKLYTKLGFKEKISLVKYDLRYESYDN